MLTHMQNQIIMGENQPAKGQSKRDSNNIWYKTQETQNIQETTSFCHSWKKSPSHPFTAIDFYLEQSSKQAG